MANTEQEKSLALPLLAGMVALSAAAVAAVLYWTSGDAPPVPGPGIVEDPGRPDSGPAAATPSSPDGRSDSTGRNPTLPKPEFVETPAVSTQTAPPKPVGKTGDSATDQVAAVAESSAPKPEKVRELKKYLRDQFDEDTQRLAIRNLRKIVKDEEYRELLADELMNPDQPEFVRNALIVDMESRNRTFMLPLMSDLATGPEHPLKDHATLYLRENLGDSYTTDPEELNEAIKAFINRRIDGF